MIIEPFVDAQAIEHGSAQFVAVVSGQPTPKLHILLDGVPYEPDWRVKFDEKIDENGSVKLVFNKINFDDEGEYTLVASNAAGKARCKAMLTVSQGGTKQAKPAHEQEGIPPVISEKLQDTVSVFELIVDLIFLQRANCSLGV